MAITVAISASELQLEGTGKISLEKQSPNQTSKVSQFFLDRSKVPAI